ncbi:hypothetical protein GCM10027282_09980 [Frigoribacterium salinisoli]
MASTRRAEARRLAQASRLVTVTEMEQIVAEAHAPIREQIALMRSPTPQGRAHVSPTDLRNQRNE